MAGLMTVNGHTEESLRALLASPFPEEAIEWKPQSAGWRKQGADPKKTEGWDGPWVKLIAFITNRAIQDRLDDVCGVSGWRNEFSPLANGAMMCGISIAFLDPQGALAWITKYDGAPSTEIESVKGGISSAMKRAATQWGIGRYLYHVDVSFGTLAAENDWSAKQVTPKKSKSQGGGDMRAFRWSPPKLPAWARFDGSGKPGVVSTIQQSRADAAVEALKKAPAGETVLPGTNRNLNGQGGKKLKDVPTLELKRAMEKLKELGTEAYTPIIEDIGEVLADRASEGA